LNLCQVSFIHNDRHLRFALLISVAHGNARLRSFCQRATDHRILSNNFLEVGDNFLDLRLALEDPFEGTFRRKSERAANRNRFFLLTIETKTPSI
jgi:hypothetical protein